jgi:hypothetical protein
MPFGTIEDHLTHPLPIASAVAKAMADKTQCGEGKDYETTRPRTTGQKQKLKLNRQEPRQSEDDEDNKYSSFNQHWDSCRPPHPRPSPHARGARRGGCSRPRELACANVSMNCHIMKFGPKNIFMNSVNALIPEIRKLHGHGKFLCAHGGDD